MEDLIKKFAGMKIERPFKPDAEWKKDEFDYFVMRSGAKENYEKESQIYFCYGRLSNRLLLLRYGITLEYNKYDHVHVRVDYLKYLKGKTDALQLIKDFKLSRYKRFKLRYTHYNFDIVNFAKAISWKFNSNSLESLFKPGNLELETKALELVSEIYAQKLQEFKHSVEENEKMLLDKSVGYHELFAVIYRLERQRILTLHKKLTDIMIQILGRLRKGIDFALATQRVVDLERADEFNRHRVMLDSYLKRFVESD
jgi:hypothetical protein